MSEANKLGGLASCKNDEFGGCEETLRANRCYMLLANGHHLAICPACNGLDKVWAAIHEHVPSRRGLRIVRSVEPDDLEVFKQVFCEDIQVDLSACVDDEHRYRANPDYALESTPRGSHASGAT